MNAKTYLSVVFLVFGSTGLLTADPVLRMVSGSSASGEVTIDFFLDYGPGDIAPAGMEWKLIVDRLQVESASFSSAGNKDLICDFNFVDSYYCLVFSLSVDPITPGKVGSVTLQPTANADLISVLLSSTLGAAPNGASIYINGAGSQISQVLWSTQLSRIRLGTVVCPTTFQPSTAAVCTVTLNTNALEDFSVSLSSSSAALGVPEKVVIKAGQNSANFLATVNFAASGHSARVTASANTVVKSVVTRFDQ